MGYKDDEGFVSVGLVSDTHGWLDPQLCEFFDGVDAIVHAGDIGQEDVLERLEELAPVTAVRGNIDGGPLRFLSEEEILKAGSRRIGVRHIAGNPRRPRKAAVEFIRRERPDIIVVGHSHVPVVGEVEEALWINPGAAGRQGFHQQRFAAFLHVRLADGELKMERIELGPRSRKHESSDSSGTS